MALNFEGVVANWLQSIELRERTSLLNLISYSLFRIKNNRFRQLAASIQNRSFVHLATCTYSRYALSDKHKYYLYSMHLQVFPLTPQILFQPLYLISISSCAQLLTTHQKGNSYLYTSQILPTCKMFAYTHNIYSTYNETNIKKSKCYIQKMYSPFVFANSNEHILPLFTAL